MRVRTLRRGCALLGVLGLTALLSPVTSTPAGAASAHYQAAADSSAVTKSTTVERTFTDDGKTTVADPKRTVTLHVAQTHGLSSLQLVHVSWSGAHPTGGIAPDVNSDLAQNEEYPMALFECRGTDSGSHAISPDTCWTQYADERFDYDTSNPPYPAWRSDAYADPADRAAFVNQPKKLNQQCASDLYGSTYARWVPFDGADGAVYRPASWSVRPRTGGSRRA